MNNIISNTHFLPEIIEYIARHLNARNLIKLSSSCKLLHEYFRQLSVRRNLGVWKYICLKKKEQKNAEWRYKLLHQFARWISLNIIRRVEKEKSKITIAKKQNKIYKPRGMNIQNNNKKKIAKLKYHIILISERSNIHFYGVSIFTIMNKYFGIDKNSLGISSSLLPSQFKSKSLLTPAYCLNNKEYVYELIDKYCGEKNIYFHYFFKIIFNYKISRYRHVSILVLKKIEKDFIRNYKII